MNIYEKLMNIQKELVVPKKHFNSFGNYNFRNLEDIQNAVKPILEKYKATLVLSDKVVLIGNRYYVKATASILDVIENASHSVNAYAREEEVKKKYDCSQLTGAASSYARKYALNGLFGIDDSKDADTTNKGDSHQQDVVKKVYTSPEKNLKCGKCGRVITEKESIFSMKEYGTYLCDACISNKLQKEFNEEKFGKILASVDLLELLEDCERYLKKNIVTFNKQTMPLWDYSVSEKKQEKAVIKYLGELITGKDSTLKEKLSKFIKLSDFAALYKQLV